MDLLARMGARTFTILDMSAGLIVGIKLAVPDAVICLRMYDEFWKRVDPVAQAGKADFYARTYLAPTDFVTPANEQNIEDGGGTYEEIADWSNRFIDEWRRLGSFCGAVTPALSPGHSEDQEDIPGVVGFQILQPAWAKYDLIGVHAYWPAFAVGDAFSGLRDISGPYAAAFYAKRNPVTYRQWFPDHDCWLGEWNGGSFVDAARDPAKATDILVAMEEYARWCATLPYLRAATYFVLDSFTQHHQLVRIPGAVDLFTRLAHETVNDPQPPPSPPPPAPFDRRPLDDWYRAWVAARAALKDAEDLAAWDAMMSLLDVVKARHGL